MYHNFRPTYKRIYVNICIALYTNCINCQDFCWVDNLCQDLSNQLDIGLDISYNKKVLFLSEFYRT